MNRLRVGLTCLARLRSFCNREPSDTLSLSSCCVAVAAPRCVCVICSFPCMSWREQKKSCCRCSVSLTQVSDLSEFIDCSHATRSPTGYPSAGTHTHTQTHTNRDTHTHRQPVAEGKELSHCDLCSQSNKVAEQTQPIIDLVEFRLNLFDISATSALSQPFELVCMCILWLCCSAFVTQPVDWSRKTSLFDCGRKQTFEDLNKPIEIKTHTNT